MPVTAQDTHADQHPQALNPYSEFLLRTAERFGVPTVLCLLVLWWAKTGIVTPLMDAHFAFISSIVQSQREHTEALGALGEKLDTLISISRDAAQKEKAQ